MQDTDPHGNICSRKLVMWRSVSTWWLRIWMEAWTFPTTREWADLYREKLVQCRRAKLKISCIHLHAPFERTWSGNLIIASQQVRKERGDGGWGNLPAHTTTSLLTLRLIDRMPVTGGYEMTGVWKSVWGLLCHLRQVMRNRLKPLFHYYNILFLFI